MAGIALAILKRRMLHAHKHTLVLGAVRVMALSAFHVLRRLSEMRLPEGRLLPVVTGEAESRFLLHQQALLRTGMR